MQSFQRKVNSYTSVSPVLRRNEVTPGLSGLLTDVFTQKILLLRFEVENKFSMLLANCFCEKSLSFTTLPLIDNYTFWLEPHGITHVSGAIFFSPMMTLCLRHLQNIKIFTAFNVITFVQNVPPGSAPLYATYKTNTIFLSFSMVKIEVQLRVM